MAELLVIRHGQASFGAENYDVLSDLGRAQARAAGDWLRQMGWTPDRVLTGTLQRQRDTATEMGFPTEETHAGFNEYDFGALLDKRFPDGLPHDVAADRRVHFQTLRETVFDWQDDKIPDPYETWAAFEARTQAAMDHATDTDARRVLVVSSGGVIGQLVAATLGAPKRQMMLLNLQIKNSAMTRFVFSKGRASLTEFNATPHFATPEGAALMSYS
ncbi:histidine phosphatase family protein [Sulfitobacter albidus]|uniref:Histidine phosphatase family protein n=1 Tax=Sulfitobacter albidus TaxID=2829501 RepID=A0A975JGV2_9RHOB|nr:histidine phosphatase family protein [Sulfitobacter albidus]QUJ78279.1 histidine phosphatase family protein [Sulfitobacter albidus]